MALEDNFLNLDPFNFDSELEHLLCIGFLSYDDCVNSYENGDMSKADFDYCKEYFEIEN